MKKLWSKKHSLPVNCIMKRRALTFFQLNEFRAVLVAPWWYISQDHFLSWVVMAGARLPSADNSTRLSTCTAVGCLRVCRDFFLSWSMILEFIWKRNNRLAMAPYFSIPYFFIPVRIFHKTYLSSHTFQSSCQATFNGFHFFLNKLLFSENLHLSSLLSKIRYSLI